VAKTKTDSDKILAALEGLGTRLEDLFILEASRAGIPQQKIREILGIDVVRVNRIAKHVKHGS
jgi:hypothetical protein